MDINQADYYKDGVARILNLMRETFGDQFKAYFDDELPNIPEELLPCIMVTETTGTISSGATTTDDITESVKIILSMSAKDDFGGSADSNLTGYKLRKLVKGQDPSTSWPFQYHEKTVMYALRTHVTMDEAVMSSTIDTEFGVNVRGDNLFTQEAHITVVITRHALVPTRS